MRLTFVWTRGSAWDNMYRVLKENNVKTYTSKHGVHYARVRGCDVMLDYRMIDWDTQLFEIAECVEVWRGNISHFETRELDF